MRYKISKSKSKEDFDNFNFLPPDGGLYTAEEALKILESSHGGIIIDERDRNFSVSYNKEDNQWLRDLLK